MAEDVLMSTMDADIGNQVFFEILINRFFTTYNTFKFEVFQIHNVSRNELK